MEDWAKQRLAELEAAAPIKRRKKPCEPFVKIPFDWAVRAAVATHCPKAVVWLWLHYRAFTQHSRTVTVPNGALAKLGVSSDAKRRALQQLKAAGLIDIAQSPRKTPVATLL